MRGNDDGRDRDDRANDAREDPCERTLAVGGQPVNQPRTLARRQPLYNRVVWSVERACLAWVRPATPGEEMASDGALQTCAPLAKASPAVASPAGASPPSAATRIQGGLFTVSGEQRSS